MTDTAAKYIANAKNETLFLLKAAQAGDKYAREKLTEDNLALVRSIAVRFYYSGREHEDLFQVGCIGLLKAIERFDPNFGVCFSTYAVPLIMGEIRRYLRDDKPVSVSRSISRQAICIEKQRQALRERLSEEPGIDLLAKECGLTPEQIVTATESQRQPVSISCMLQERNEDSISAFSRDDSEELTERLSMDALLAELPDKLAHILRKRYYEEKTQADLGKELGVSQVQISRLEKKALLMIKDKL